MLNRSQLLPLMIIKISLYIKLLPVSLDLIVAYNFAVNIYELKVNIQHESWTEINPGRCMLIIYILFSHSCTLFFFAVGEKAGENK